ncbi:bifunctional UDP-N-acetylglucosamine diphosphorylase/glucosamine-1-phosphate N-acetyltransferase GlmU [Sulfurospirillum deleyianum]|uniref:Bifunctional protein GlmU n=1 Tax=Sulfurospirillum deleyianum (strain ATCC 51133 / DSM 6946 / 5175) TaxID=525898 RepID=D1B226_SULD5|nr:bifunctional UDP-N-acetylglucosamine diphosphorylase/glucosamine-1-phosphate N-acetyltransferase GlmU [Sulfurospirillum deleyianum]ACZ12146.1 UDP-N-acetylglucosamine pyrophosphorylase [Sulfurospirillum deleyianum DSM 6946]
MNISIAIMAAGLGTRMKSTLPKVLHEISGFEMLYHIIKESQKISDDIHVILYHQAELVQEKMNRYFSGIHYVIQDHQNFPGTGGAIRGVNPKYEKLLVLNGDMPLLEAENMQNFAHLEADVVMSTFTCKEPFGYGRVIMDNEHNVLKIVEEKDANTEEKKVTAVNAGVYLFRSDFLKENLCKLTNENSQKEYYITDLIALANAQNRAVKALFVDEKTFMGVNSKHHLSIAEELMQERMKRRFMEQGVSMRLPSTIYIEADVQIRGECKLENGVTLLKGTVLENAHIKAHSVIEKSVIKNSDIGPMARIRPGSIIEDTHIGNFVEVKKSTLKGVKAGHLSYLGDASIDEGTNIGCGTITCNYDGKAKYQTIIGKNVFVGSDSQLVAPLTIADDVLIASGTTVTKNIPKGALAINRAPLKIMEGFFYKFFGKNHA